MMDFTNLDPLVRSLLAVLLASFDGADVRLSIGLHACRLQVKDTIEYGLYVRLRETGNQVECKDVLQDHDESDWSEI